MTEENKFFFDRKKSKSVHFSKNPFIFGNSMGKINTFKINLNNSNDNNNSKLNQDLNNSKNNIINQDINRNSKLIYNPNHTEPNDASYSFSNKYKNNLKNNLANNFLEPNKNMTLKLNLKENQNYQRNNQNIRLSTLNISNIKNPINSISDKRNSNTFINKNENQEKINFLTERTNIPKIDKKNTFIITSKGKRNSINDYLYKRFQNSKNQKISRNSAKFQKLNSLIVNNKSYVKTITNPLLISEDDMIFEERKKYLFYKYETKKRLNKTMNGFKRKAKKINTNVLKLKILKERKNKLLTTDKKRLNYIYLSTNQITKKLKKIEKNKDKQNLNQYQNSLLNVIKPSISGYRYINLKDRLMNIRNYSKIKDNENNISKIKDIEFEEQKIIEKFNENCINYIKKLEEEKNIHNSLIKLPLLDFISCLKGKKLKK